VAQLITQYVLIIFLILGFAYLIYLLNDREIKIRDDYFGITYCILNTLELSEATAEDVKNIIRTISGVVSFIEANYKDEENSLKEEKALSLARSAINALNFTSTIDDESIRFIIRIASACLPPTNKILWYKVKKTELMFLFF